MLKTPTGEYAGIYKKLVLSSLVWNSEEYVVAPNVLDICRELAAIIEAPTIYIPLKSIKYLAIIPLPVSLGTSVSECCAILITQEGTKVPGDIKSSDMCTFILS